MARFDLENYETVADRLVKFWRDYPNGQIHTELLNTSSEKMQQFVVKALVYKDAADARPWATGLAEEHFGDRGPNETSPVENCETSAIGRALANAGYATTSESRPSREEMSKVNRAVGNRVEKVQEVREQVKRGPQHDVAADPRFETIKQGAFADPSNQFLADLVKKGGEYGKLSEKQLAAGFNAARKALDSTPRKGEAVTVGDIANAFGASDEPF